MKRYFNIPLAIVLLAGVLVVGAQAQSSSTQRVIATIPFAFSVGKTTLPAGRYTITVLNSSSDLKILQVRSMDGRSSAIMLTTSVPVSATEHAKLVFERYGDQYFFGKPERAERNALAKANKKSVVMIAAG